MGRQTVTRPFSSEIATAMVQVSQNLGMGSAAIGLGGAGIGIGMVFAALLMAVARNPSMRGQLFSYAILGFAFVEAIGLFDLMVAMVSFFPKNWICKGLASGFRPALDIPSELPIHESRQILTNREQMCKYV